MKGVMRVEMNEYLVSGVEVTLMLFIHLRWGTRSKAHIHELFVTGMASAASSTAQSLGTSNDEHYIYHSCKVSAPKNIAADTSPKIVRNRKLSIVIGLKQSISHISYLALKSLDIHKNQ